jgi:hypothetical protein
VHPDPIYIHPASPTAVPIDPDPSDVAIGALASTAPAQPIPSNSTINPINPNSVTTGDGTHVRFTSTVPADPIPVDPAPVSTTNPMGITLANTAPTDRAPVNCVPLTPSPVPSDVTIDPVHTAFVSAAPADSVPVDPAPMTSV